MLHSLRDMQGNHGAASFDTCRLTYALRLSLAIH
jgi:hypothetical protein